jgi:MFS transporter, MHS family, citrate/tricarballylate:H+ symporter
LENPAAPGQLQHLPLRKVFGVGLGNALEFYDFLTFSSFAIQIGHNFYPEGQTTHGLLYTLATFGLGFLTRPLGGWIIGGYGDRAGRRPAMALSFTLMGAAILGIALTPSYARIGAAAPMLLGFFRLVQGFALGGAIGPATAFLVESAPPNRRGLYVSLQYATQDISILMSGGVGFALSLGLTPGALEDWGWRLALGIGVLIVPLGLWLRRSLPETAPPRPADAPARRNARAPLRLLVIGGCMIAQTTVCGYVLSYFTTYVQDSLKLSSSVAFAATMVVGLFEASGDVCGGLLSDRYGRRPVMLVATLALLVFTVPLFVFLNRSAGVVPVFAAIAVLSVLVAIAVNPMLVTVTESLPAATRSGTLSTLYAVSVAIFGGTTQFMVKWLTDLSGSSLAPAFYMCASIVLGGSAALAARESAPGRAGDSRRAPPP